MRKLVMAGAAGLLALTALASSADAHPRWGYGGYGYRGYGYGYAAPTVRFNIGPPVVVNPYPYAYPYGGYSYSPYDYDAPRYYAPPVRVYRPYWGHRWHRW